MPLGAGSLLGTNIRLVRELGRGGMGAVWLAENTSLRAHVAVKVLHPSLVTDEGARARFRQEARAVAQLDSPHVVRIFDFGVADEGEPYIVMELLRGRDLKQHVEEQGLLAPAEAAIILRQLCRGLAAAHDVGIVHRDIKLSNVFLSQTDGEPFVKVLDFGVARVARPGDMGLTETGSTIGTPYYMSPEQLVDPRAIDQRSDLWSVAVVAYASLLGRLPFHGETVSALAIAIHEGHFPQPTQIRPELPATLDAFFAHALQRRAEARFPTARAFADAFDAATASVVPRSAAVPAQPAGAPWAASSPIATGAATASPFSPAVTAATAAPAIPFGAPSPASTVREGGGVQAPFGSGSSPAAQATGGPQVAYAAPSGAPGFPAAGAASGALPGQYPAPTSPPAGQPMAAPFVPVAQTGPTGLSAAYSIPGAGSRAAATMAEPRRRSSLLGIGLAIAFLGIGATAAALLLPTLLDSDGKPTRAAPDEPTAKGRSSAAATSTSSAAATATTASPRPSTPSPPAHSPVARPSATTPTPTPTATATATPTPAAGLRPRGIVCTKYPKTQRCHPCCPFPGDILKPYPDCGCYFDPSKQ